MDMINIKKLYHSLLKVIREEKITGKARLVLAGAALGTGLLFSGCEEQIVTPDGQVATVTVDDQNNVSVTIDDQQQTPDTQDPVDDPEPEVVEPEVVEVPEPKFILYDEEGNYYKPQHITADDIYTRISEVEEKYDFDNDWERDIYVSNLVAYNSGSMDKSDIEAIYYDYLGNLGYKVIQQQLDYFGAYIYRNENEIPMSEYFIDPVLAEEAATFENYIDSKSPNMAAEKFNKLLKEIKTEQSIDEYAPEMYNDLLLLEYNVYSGCSLSKTVEDFFDGDNYRDYKKNSLKVYTGIAYNNSGEFENYSISDYVSSHQDEKVK